MCKYYLNGFLLLMISLFTLTYGLRPNSFNISDMSGVLPQKNDLVIYLESLQLILEFCMKNKYDLDLNFEFGIFLANVNLKSILEKKRNNMPRLIHLYMKLLLTLNDDLVDFFNGMVRKNQDTQEKESRMIVSLFSNETQWIEKIPMFDTALMAEASGHFQEPASWSEYVKHVGSDFCDVGKVSDKCMVSLANNEVYESKNARCKVARSCHDFLFNGTAYGNSLSHRLLFLLHARYARGCSIFSYEEDKDMIKTICAMSYEEAQYIAKHSYGIVDLIMEQITLCSLDGHAQFLQRYWLSSILHFQTPSGCFGQDPFSPEASTTSSVPSSSKTWEMARRRSHSILGGLCDGHVTAVAVATLSAAIRYILEVYY